ncbi:MAG: hypothetical protein ACE5H5_03645 [Nitrospinota bacterium]
MRNNMVCLRRVLVMLVLLAGGLGAWAPGPARAQEERDPAEAFAMNRPCVLCHQNAALVKKTAEGSKSMFADPRPFYRSAHWDFPCVECHADIPKEKPETIPAKEVVLDEQKRPVHRKTLKKVDCITFCHDEPGEEYNKSLHVAAMKARKLEVTNCKGCHETRNTPHQASPVHRRAVNDICGKCHPAALASYRKTLHGQIASLGYTTEALPTCADCHGFHRVALSPTPFSPIAPKTLEAACRRCHRQLRPKLVDFVLHPEDEAQLPYPRLFAVRQFMRLLLSLVMGLGLVHTGLWGWRSMRDRQSGTSEAHPRDEEGA